MGGAMGGAVGGGGKAADPLSVSGLRVSFGARDVLRDVSLSAAPGRVLALVGESGSGKSVLARTLVGLAGRGARISGRVEVGGRSVLGLSERALSRIRGTAVSLMVQDSMSSLDPVWRVGSQLMETLALKSPRPAAVEWRSRLLKGRALKAAMRGLALEALAEAGLEDPEERFEAFPHQLSGGQRQRVAMAMALAGDPDLLVADEPTTALDVVTQRRLMNRLVGGIRRRGAALALISHDLALVGELADDLVVLYAGRVMETGPAAGILSGPAHPYTRALLSARDLGAGVLPPPPDGPGTAGEGGCPFRGRCREASGRCAVLPELRPVGEARSSRCHQSAPRPAVPAAKAA